MTVHTEWSEIRLKFLADGPLQYGANESGEVDDCGPRYVRITDIGDDGQLRTDGIRTLPVQAARPYLLRHGDVLFARSGATVGKTVMYQDAWGACCYAGYLIRVRTDARRLDARYLHYFTQSAHYWDQIRSAQTQATIENVGAQRLANFSVPHPGVDVQCAIADYLDKKTAAIDALIAKKERLIELLQEKRQALITQAVTKGLDPNVPMKDSGVEWLGEIPAHWQVLTLTRVVKTFVDYRGRTPEKVDGGVPLITAGAVRNGRVDHDRAPEYVTEDVYRELSQRGKPAVGDILFTSEAPLGEVGLVEDTRIACAQRIIMFKVDRAVMDPEFLLLYLLSPPGRTEIASRASGSTAEGIRADRLRMAAVPVPPLAEQAHHAAVTRHAISKHEPIVVLITKHIDRLREYRQALITEAVTGKLDVTEERA